MPVMPKLPMTAPYRTPKQQITKTDCARARPSGSACVRRRSPRSTDSALWSSRVMAGDSGKEAMDRVEDRLEEVGFAPTEPAESALRSSQEGPQHPGHLRPHQPENDHPDP